MCLLENWHCFPGGSVVNNPPASIGDAGSIPGPGRSPGEGIATQSSVLTWEIQRRATFYGVELGDCTDETGIRLTERGTC